MLLKIISQVFQNAVYRGHQLYVPDEKEVFLAVGEKKEVALAAKPRLGGITVYVEPFEARDADIFVGSEPVGKAPKPLSLIIGNYSITARKTNFLDKAESVSIRENEQQKLTFTLVTYEGSRQSSIDSWARNKWISAGIAVLAGAAYVYSQKQADTNYESYRLSANPADATKFRDETNKFNSYVKISIGVGIAGVVGAITSWIWQSTY